ncbi:MAG: hypothetical protein GX217_00125, partial [Clostridiaceae bacterium]|nr:hypothetical protein [Clostridiaceae bacterium]
EKLTSQLKEGEKKLALLNAELKKAEEAPIEQKVTKRKKVLIPKEVTDRFVDRVSKSLTELVDTISVDGIEQVKAKMQGEGIGFEKLSNVIDEINDSVSTESLEKLQKSVDAFMQKLATVAEELSGIGIKEGNGKGTKQNIIDSVVDKLTKELEAAVKSTDIEVMEKIKLKTKALYASFRKLSNALNAIWEEEKTSINTSLLPLQKAIAGIGNGFSDITEALNNIQSSELSDVQNVADKISTLIKNFSELDSVIDNLLGEDGGLADIPLVSFERELSGIGNNFTDITGILNNISTDTMGDLRLSIEGFKEALSAIGRELVAPVTDNDKEFDVKKFQELYRDQIVNTLAKEFIGDLNLLRRVKRGKGSFEDISNDLDAQLKKTNEDLGKLWKVLAKNKIDFKTQVSEARKSKQFLDDFEEEGLDKVFHIYKLPEDTTFERLYGSFQKKAENLRSKQERFDEILKGKTDLVSDYKDKKWSYISKEDIHKKLTSGGSVSLEGIRNGISALGQNFEGISRELKTILAVKEAELDSKMLPLQANIIQLGSSFDDVNSALERSGSIGFKASVEGFANTLEKLNASAKAIFEKLSNVIDEINDSVSTESLEKLQKSVDAFMQKLATVAEEIASINIKGGKTKVSKKNIVESVSAKIRKELEEALASTNLDTMRGIKDRVKALYASFKKLSDALSTILSEERTSINSTLLPLQKAIAEIGNGFVDITEALGNIKSGSLPNSEDFSRKISSLNKKFNDVAKVIDSIASIDKGSITSQLLPFQKELNKLGNIFMDINGALNNVGTNTMGQLRVAVDSFKESLEHIGEEIASVGGAGGGEFDIKKYQEMYRKQILNTLNEENIGHINILRDIREGKGSFEDVEKYINHQIRQEAEARRNLRTVLDRNKLEFDTPIKEALKLEAFRKDYKDYKLEGIIPSGDLSSLDTFKKFYDISQSSTDYYIRKEKRLAEILKGESDLLDKFEGKKWTSVSKEEIHKTISGSNLSELIVKSIQEKIVNQITAVTNNISALLDNSFKDDVDVKKIEKSIGNLKTKISVNLVKSLNGVIEDLTKL